MSQAPVVEGEKEKGGGISIVVVAVCSLVNISRIIIKNKENKHTSGSRRVSSPLVVSSASGKFNNFLADLINLFSNKPAK